MPISHKSKLLFVHIPKTGGTSIEKMFDMSLRSNFFTRFSGRMDYQHILENTSMTETEKRICGLKNMQHFTFKELKKILPAETVNSYFKFSVVRNPYDRVISEYFHCKNGDSRLQRPYNDMTLENFINSVFSLSEEDRIFYCDGHMETQSSYLVDENNSINGLDKIYRFENFSECLIDLKTRTGSTIKEVHSRKTERNSDYNTYYTPEIKKKVYDFYKIDFDTFGYLSEL